MSGIPEHREPITSKLSYTRRLSKQLTTPAPTPAYSEAPEVYTTPLPTGPPSEISAQNTGSVSAMNSYAPTPTSGEKQYPFQPDSVGEIPPHSDEKNYPNQPPQFQHQQGPQQFYTPQAHPSGYATVVPLHGLQSAPCPVDCPACGERELTRITPVSGGTTQ
jgi:lipopolysaccharide-induced tumor necrosis factor-alpha factor